MKPAPVLRLHGYPVSNYVNIVHAALIEKGVDFELVPMRAGQEPAMLAKSPMGKIPVLETPDGWLTETVAILEYLEDTAGGGLYPDDAFSRARCRQLINIVQMYVEAPTRSLFPGVFFGGRNSSEAIQTARLMLDRSGAALTRLADPVGSFLVGETLSHADLFAFYCLDITERVTRFVYARSFLAEAGLEGWSARMAGRDSSRRVLAGFEAAFGPYLIDRNAAYRPIASDGG